LLMEMHPKDDSSRSGVRSIKGTLVAGPEVTHGVILFITS